MLRFLSRVDPGIDKIRNELIVAKNWTNQEFRHVSKRLKNYQCDISFKKSHLEELHSFLTKRRDLLMMLLVNPTLLEHETFTDLLHAVHHLTQELTHRKRLHDLPDTDYAHLAGDVRRVYTYLIHEWVGYMKYLKENYPYLFSFAMRTNPFDLAASPVEK